MIKKYNFIKLTFSFLIILFFSSINISAQNITTSLFVLPDFNFTNGILYHANGERANYGDTWYHANGVRANYGDTWYHANGERANYGDTWYHPNGERVNY